MEEIGTYEALVADIRKRSEGYTEESLAALVDKFDFSKETNGDQFRVYLDPNTEDTTFDELILIGMMATRQLVDRGAEIEKAGTGSDKGVDNRVFFINGNFAGQSPGAIYPGWGFDPKEMN